MGLHNKEFEYKVKYWDPTKSYLKIRDEVLKAVDEVGMSGNMILGPAVEEFEKKLTDFLGVKYAIGLNSGTDALYLALRALGIKKGDEVITVSNTFIASVSEIARVGARPVLVDIGEDYLIDPLLVSKAITKNTKAIIAVHLSGDVANIIELKKFGLPVIEDAAQAFGASIGGLKVGTIGEFGCFSFYPAKLLGSWGDAGAIVTNDEQAYKKIILLRDHNLIGKSPDISIEEFGMNSRLDSVQAAYLNVKMKYIDEILNLRAAAAEKYYEQLVGIPEVVLPVKRIGRVWQDYIIRAKRRDELAKFLDENDIKVRAHDLLPNHYYKVLSKFKNRLPKSTEYHYQFLRLPFSAEITDEDISTVSSKIKQFYGK